MSCIIYLKLADVILYYYYLSFRKYILSPQLNKSFETKDYLLLVL